MLPGNADCRVLGVTMTLWFEKSRRPYRRWQRHTLDVGTRNSVETGELDVRGPDRPGELALTENSADRAQPVSRDEPRSRDEVHAETRERVEGGWERRLFEAPRTEPGRFAPRAGRVSAGRPRRRDRLRGAAPGRVAVSHPGRYLNRNGYRATSIALQMRGHQATLTPRPAPTVPAPGLDTYSSPVNAPK
jgi:hypothetical protein